MISPQFLQVAVFYDHPACLLLHVCMKKHAFVRHSHNFDYNRLAQREQCLP